MPAGRPTIYTPELAAEVLKRLADGGLLIEICAEDWAPARTTIYRWDLEKPEFRSLFAHARELQAHACAERAVQEGRRATAEDANAARVRLDANKWFASKVLPKVYGDTARRELTGAGGGPIDIRALTTEQIAAILNAQAADGGDPPAAGGTGTPTP